MFKTFISIGAPNESWRALALMSLAFSNLVIFSIESDLIECGGITILHWEALKNFSKPSRKPFSEDCRLWKGEFIGEGFCEEKVVSGA